MDQKARDEATARVREFYDGPADTIYKTTWGENLHLGMPRVDGGTHREAIEHTTKLMARHAELNENTRVLDLGSGYGGPARSLASRFRCRVTGLNVSSVETEEAVRLTKETKLDSRVFYDVGDFHELPYRATSFDVVWSQDALMYGADKRKILEEILRVLEPGGLLDFTDILANPDLEPDDRARLYERVRTPEMWDTERYLSEMLDLGFTIQRVEDWSEHVAANYAWAAEQTRNKRDELVSAVGAELVKRTLDGLAFWVDMAERGNVGWALIVAKKPEHTPCEASRHYG